MNSARRRKRNSPIAIQDGLKKQVNICATTSGLPGRFFRSIPFCVKYTIGFVESSLSVCTAIQVVISGVWTGIQDG